MLTDQIDSRWSPKDEGNCAKALHEFLAEKRGASFERWICGVRQFKTSLDLLCLNLQA